MSSHRYSRFWRRFQQSLRFGEEECDILGTRTINVGKDRHLAIADYRSVREMKFEWR